MFNLQNSFYPLDANDNYYALYLIKWNKYKYKFKAGKSVNMANCNA